MCTYLIGQQFENFLKENKLQQKQPKHEKWEDHTKYLDWKPYLFLRQWGSSNFVKKKYAANKLGKIEAH